MNTMSKYKITMGLEIHVQLKTNSKLFSCASTLRTDNPNENIQLLDLGIPGALPLLNKKAVELAIMVVLALNGEVNLNSTFDRKHYKYPDLPLGFQITQFFNPIGRNCYLTINEKKYTIQQIHMETDAGKTIHLQDISMRNATGKSEDLLDFNRCGMPLIEIVTNPCFSDAKEVKEFLKELILNLKYSGASDCNLEDGNIRFDVNISLSDNEKLGQRVEIKNLNSFEGLMSAIEYESNRQEELLNNGKTINQETRGWNEKITYTLRNKEDSVDYGYIPEWDLPILHIEEFEVEELKRKLPKLPSDYRKMFNELTFEVPKKTQEVLLSDMKLIEFCWSCNLNITIINLLANDVLSIHNWFNYKDHLMIIFEYLNEQLISIKVAKELIDRIEENPAIIVEKENKKMIVDENQINECIQLVFQSNAKEYERYLNGDEKIKMFFYGQVLKKINASPNILNKLLG